MIRDARRIRRELRIRRQRRDTSSGAESLKLIVVADGEEELAVAVANVSYGAIVAWRLPTRRDRTFAVRYIDAW